MVEEEKNGKPGDDKPGEDTITEEEILKTYKDHDKKFVSREVFDKLNAKHNAMLKDIMDGKFKSSEDEDSNEDQENNETQDEFEKLSFEELNKISYDQGSKTKNVDFWRAQLAIRKKMINEKGIDPFITAGFDQEGNALNPVPGEKESVENACEIIESFIEESYDETTKTYNNQVFDTLFTKKFKA